MARVDGRGRHGEEHRGRGDDATPQRPTGQRHSSGRPTTTAAAIARYSEQVTGQRRRCRAARASPHRAAPMPGAERMRKSTQPSTTSRNVTATAIGRGNASRPPPRAVAPAPDCRCGDVRARRARLGALPHALGTPGSAQLYAGMLGLHGIGGAARPSALYIAISAASSGACRRNGAGRSRAGASCTSRRRRCLFVVAAASVYTSHPFIYFRF